MAGLRRYLLSKNTRKNYPTIIFFFVLFIIGLTNFKSYGIAWDSPNLRFNGGGAAIYVADKINLGGLVPDYYREFTPMGENGMVDHGVAYDLPLAVLEVALGINDSMQIYQFRSLINFLVFALGTFSIYCLVKRRLKSRNIALLASTFYVLSPRIFAAGFYSPSDMIFTGFFVMATNLCIKFLESPTKRNAIFAGIASGYAVDIRILGIIIFPIIVFFYLTPYFHQPKPILAVKPLLTYLATGIASIYAFFPYLWESPINRFIEVFKSLSKYGWGGENLYFGQFISANDLPWHYVPVWVSITTPIFYLILFCIGVYAILKSLGRKIFDSFDKIQDLIFLGLVLGPIFIVVSLNSVLYDTWRHLSFIYPFIIVIAIIGWTQIATKRSKSPRLFTAKIMVTTLALMQISYWMVVNNPNQNLYFNEFAGSKNLEMKWEMDYWGLSNKQAINYLFDRSENKEITVGVISFTPFEMSLKSVKSEYQTRLKVVDMEEEPDYIINNYRMVKSNPAKYLDNYKLLKVYTIDGSRYFEIWQRNLR
jgi:4-amino-4-deoxy-L-arabinose transferase-like glycosyltransferase